MVNRKFPRFSENCFAPLSIEHNKAKIDFRKFSSKKKGKKRMGEENEI